MEIIIDFFLYLRTFVNHGLKKETTFIFIAIKNEGFTLLFGKQIITSNKIYATSGVA